MLLDNHTISNVLNGFFDVFDCLIDVYHCSLIIINNDLYTHWYRRWLLDVVKLIQDCRMRHSRFISTTIMNAVRLFPIGLNQFIKY